MTDLKWEIEEFSDGSVEIKTLLRDEIVRRDLIRIPPGAGRDHYLHEFMYSIGRDYEARKEFQRKKLELQARIHDLKAKIDTREKPASPPILAEMLISLIAPEKTAQVQLGDLQEMFQKNVERCGEREARRMYWIQVTDSALPLLWGWIKRLGLFTFFVDYVRSKLGL